MCGICGKILLDEARQVDPATIERMTRVIHHRGPDDAGYHYQGNVGLGHRRLAIIDLNSGHQPISNEDDSVWVAFNGEIYNFPVLRDELLRKGHRFKTNSDTEVIVHLYEEYGKDFASHLFGMFAVAIHDVPRRRLVLARDRVGIKPLYYARTDEAIVFASEIKALLQDPGLDAAPDLQALDRFLSFYYLPGTRTMFQGVEKLPPGHVMVVERGRVTIDRYWELRFASAGAPAGDYPRAVEELNGLLTEVVRDHMLSDVPVGVLASGGVDSTAVLSIAAGASTAPLSTFTVGFDHPGVVDERKYARLAAEAFGTKHHEIAVSPAAFTDFLPTYVWHMEEPVCEPPAIALYYLSRLASEHVKVVLSGEGGDEAFAGYSNYASMLRLVRLKRLLGPARNLCSRVALALARRDGSQRSLERAGALGMPLSSYYLSRTSNPFRLFNRVPEELYADEFLESLDKRESLRPARELLEGPSDRSVLSEMLRVDTHTWLVDDLLVKADKMTMANSLELRVPLLDHRVLEFAAALPDSFKLQGRKGKRILKDCFTTRVPAPILERPKAGFPVPYEAWFRGELKEYLCSVLLDASTVRRGYFRQGAVERLIQQNSPATNTSKELFCLLVLEWWHRVFVDGAGAKPAEARETLTVPTAS